MMMMMILIFGSWGRTGVLMHICYSSLHSAPAVGSWVTAAEVIVVFVCWELAEKGWSEVEQFQKW